MLRLLPDNLLKYTCEGVLIRAHYVRQLDNIHKTTYIQDGMDDILKMEEELLRDLKQNKSRALERAVLFYLRLCEENEEFLQSHDYSHDMIKERLSEIAERLGIAGIIKAIYI